MVWVRSSKATMSKAELIGTDEKSFNNVLNLVVCILLRVLDQVQGFPSNTILFQ
jgi:hypothetical protein